MTKAPKVGDRVTHFKHGRGVVQRLLFQDFAGVLFGQTLHYVQRKNLLSLDKIEREARDKRERERESVNRELKNRVNSLLGKYTHKSEI